MVTSFFRQFGWFGTGFRHGAYHLCQNTCFCFLGEVKALDYQSRWQWMIAASLAKVCLYIARHVLAKAMGRTDPGSRAPERRGLSGRQRFFQLFLFYGHVISFIVHDIKGLVSEINIHLRHHTCYPSSYANLAAKIIHRGRCDKTGRMFVFRVNLDWVYQNSGQW